MLKGDDKMAKQLKIDWSHITLSSVIAFLIGWFFLGLFGAVVIAIIVLVLMGIIKFK